MGEPSNLEQCMTTGLWGGPGGNEWSCKSKGGIKQIIIHHGWVIDSILFKTDDGNGLLEYSMKFGGDGGNHTNKIDIDWPMEYLTGLSRTYDSVYPFGPVVIKSMCFYTNLTRYGPIGSNSGTRFSIPLEDYVIVGFHGRAGCFLDAIGVYAKPIISSICLSGQAYPNNQEVIDKIKLDVPHHPSPWDGVVGGKPWDDGVFSAIKQVHVHVGSGVIHALQFHYERFDGKCVWSQMHGGPGGDIINRINLDCPSEFLVGITGSYGAVKGDDDSDEAIIRSISFHSTKGIYGPFGEEIGNHFSSGFGGKILGFHGSSDVYVFAIGVHMEYF